MIEAFGDLDDISGILAKSRKNQDILADAFEPPGTHPLDPLTRRFRKSVFKGILLKQQKLCKDLCAGGVYANLTDVELKRKAHLTTRNVVAEHAFGRIGYEMEVVAPGGSHFHQSKLTIWKNQILSRWEHQLATE